MAMLKKCLIVLFASWLTYWIFSGILHFGFFRHVYNHAPGDCFRLAGTDHGSEDIQVMPNGLAFISSGLAFLKAQSDDTIGKIFLFDFNHPKLAPLELKITGEEKYKTLNPHGINIWTDEKTGTVYLYVINHTPDGEAVDKFKFNPAKKTLEHIRRIENQSNFHEINDLVVVGDDQFYYTNYLYTHEYGKLETILNLHWGSVGFYNGKNATLLETGLGCPNGIALSKDKKKLYVALIGNEAVAVYQRKDDGSLTLDQSIFIGTLPDNLDVDAETGDIWIGAHPAGFKILKYLDDPKKHISPSHVLKIHFPASPGSSPEVVEVYSNDGAQISGSSVAVRYKKAMLIGSVCTHALYCQINHC